MAARDMAYGGSNENANGTTLTQGYRLRRGFPYMRAGRNVSAIPQFKTLAIYSHTTNAPGTFQTSTTGVKIQWPVPPK